MAFPFWAVFGLVAACFSAGMMLLQEKLRVNGYALAFWVKVAAALVTLPFLLAHGIPGDPRFYFYLALTAVLYAINDVIFFEGITKTNAGAVSRLVPAASIFSFLLWFVVDPSLVEKYLGAPVISVLIFVTLCLFAFFAFRLKKCSVTMNTLRAIWYVLLAATLGPMLTKMTTFYAPKEQAIFAYVFFQALMMMGLWLGWLVVRRPVPLSDFFSKTATLHGLLIGLVASGMMLTKFTSFVYVDNPAYIPAIMALDSVIILLFYRFRGLKIEGDIRSGLGIVACAAALVILKAQV